MRKWYRFNSWLFSRMISFSAKKSSYTACRPALPGVAPPRRIAHRLVEGSLSVHGGDDLANRDISFIIVENDAFSTRNFKMNGRRKLLLGFIDNFTDGFVRYANLLFNLGKGEPAIFGIEQGQRLCVSMNSFPCVCILTSRLETFVSPVDKPKYGTDVRIYKQPHKTFRRHPFHAAYRSMCFSIWRIAMPRDKYPYK